MKARLAIFLLAYISVCAESYALPAVVDNSAYPATSAGPANLPPSPSTNSLFELMGRLEQLQAEVQQLTGKVEEQANTIAELKKQQSTMYSDFDERVQGLENKVDGTGQPTPEIPQEPAASGESETNQADTPKTEAPTTSEPATDAGSAQQPVPAEKAPAPKADVVPVSDAEKQEYQQAYNELRLGHTNESISAFNAYLEKYPTGGYANNAQYWLGEAYRVNQDDDSARKAFNAVIEKYPNSAKVPDAILKLGYIEMDQKNSVKAREYLTRVTTDFPNTAAARLATKKLLLLDAVSN